jgi:hypothetical protein
MVLGSCYLTPFFFFFFLVLLVFGLVEKKSFRASLKSDRLTFAVGTLTATLSTKYQHNGHGHAGMVIQTYKKLTA